MPAALILFEYDKTPIKVNVYGTFDNRALKNAPENNVEIPENNSAYGNFSLRASSQILFIFCMLIHEH